MSSGGGGNGVDTEYNARMATLSEEEHGWAEEFMNFYKYGDTYDPNEEVWVDADGNISNEAPKKTKVIPGYTRTVRDESAPNGIRQEWVPDQIVSVGDDAGWTKKKRGEIEGYDPGAQTSYMDMEKQQIADNMAIMPHMRDQAISEASLGKASAKTQEALLPQYQTMMGNQYDYGAQKAITDKNLLGDYESSTRSNLKFQGAQADANLSLLPQQTQLRGALNTEQLQNVGYRAPIAKQYFTEVAKGKDVQGEVNKASADVASAYKGAGKRAIETMGRYGINPNSGRGRSAIETSSLSYGRDQAAARTAARTNTENENFERRRQALSGVSGAIY